MKKKNLSGQFCNQKLSCGGFSLFFLMIFCKLNSQESWLFSCFLIFLEFFGHINYLRSCLSSCPRITLIDSVLKNRKNRYRLNLRLKTSRNKTALFWNFLPRLDATRITRCDVSDGSDILISPLVFQKSHGKNDLSRNKISLTRPL